MVAHFNLISLYRTIKYRFYDITEFQISRSKVKVTRGQMSQNLIIAISRKLYIVSTHNKNQIVA